MMPSIISNQDYKESLKDMEHFSRESSLRDNGFKKNSYTREDNRFNNDNFSNGSRKNSYSRNNERFGNNYSNHGRNNSFSQNDEVFTLENETKFKTNKPKGIEIQDDEFERNFYSQYYAPSDVVIDTPVETRKYDFPIDTRNSTNSAGSSKEVRIELTNPRFKKRSNDLYLRPQPVIERNRDIYKTRFNNIDDLGKRYGVLQEEPSELITSRRKMSASSAGSSRPSTRPTRVNRRRYNNSQDDDYYAKLLKESIQNDDFESNYSKSKSDRFDSRTRMQMRESSQRRKDSVSSSQKGSIRPNPGDWI